MKTQTHGKISRDEMIEFGRGLVDYADIASSGTQSIFDGLMGITNNVRLFSEHMADKATDSDLRMYIQGILNQLDGLSLHASIVSDNLARTFNKDLYDTIKYEIAEKEDKDRNEIIKEQRISETIRLAKKLGFLDDLKKAVESELNSKKSKKESK